MISIGGELVSMNQLIYFGVILDPCFKMRYLGYVSPTMYNDQFDVAKSLLAKIKDNLCKMYDWYAVHDQQNRARPSSSLVLVFPFNNHHIEQTLCFTWKK
jgi:hypothetical protein